MCLFYFLLRLKGCCTSNKTEGPDGRLWPIKKSVELAARLARGGSAILLSTPPDSAEEVTIIITYRRVLLLLDEVIKILSTS